LQERAAAAGGRVRVFRPVDRPFAGSSGIRFLLNSLDRNGMQVKHQIACISFRFTERPMTGISSVILFRVRNWAYGPADVVAFEVALPLHPSNLRLTPSKPPLDCIWFMFAGVDRNRIQVDAFEFVTVAGLPLPSNAFAGDT